MSDHYFYGHGKLLLTGEYFVMDGASALAMPCKFGQRLYVSSRPSREPKFPIPDFQPLFGSVA